MFERLRPLVLRWLRVPPDPEPPVGAPGSVRVFRAGARFYHVRLANWALAQLGAAASIVFSIGFLTQLESNYDAAQETRAARLRASEASPGPSVAASIPAEAPPKPPEERGSKKKRQSANQAFYERVPPWVVPLVKVAELLGVLGFLLQLPFTFAAVRLDWEYRWYIVTDRSLRIRAGLWSLRESTMSFANLQQVEMRQGPVQRLLGIADVRVQSAGGGGQAKAEGAEMHDSLHTGLFRGVDNAPEIRDLILDRLRHFREAGLDDPDDTSAREPEPATAAAAGEALAAAREVLAEARALHVAARLREE